MMTEWNSFTLHNFYDLGEIGNVRLFVKRDDLIPFSFGGNKVRIARELIADLTDRGYNAVVSYGSATSNLNRAVADTARAAGLPCYVIIKQEGGIGRSFNEELVRQSDARIFSCTADRVRETVEQVMAQAEQDGFRPYYVYGDSSGHGNEEALMRAGGLISRDIWTWEREHNMSFSHIFLAVGTGATISGLAAGISEHCEVEESRCSCIHGISVARTADKAESAVKGYLAACGYDTPDCMSLIQLTDRYLGTGYGDNTADPGTLAAYRSIYGLPLDRTYTGKAFCGMLNEIREQDIQGNVLFIHTGGLPLVFDDLMK